VTTNWTEEELLCYLLIFCSKADLTITVEEKNYLTDRFDKNLLTKMMAIFEKDTVEERMSKIKDSYDDHIFENNETDVIYEEIHNIFTADGEFDQLEKNVLKQLDKILN